MQDESAVPITFAMVVYYTRSLKSSPTRNVFTRYTRTRKIHARKQRHYIYIYIYIVFVFEHRFNSVKKFKCIQVGLLKEDEEAF